MAAFTTMEQAEERARAKMEDYTWIVAFAQRDFTGAISVRFQRPMSAASPDNGAWVETTQDNVT